MALTMHGMAAGSFAAMLQSLSECLDKAVAQKGKGADLVNARLAPDMYTFAQQIQQATHYVHDCLSRLAGKGGTEMPAAQTTIPALKKQLAGAIALAQAAPSAAFDGAETRDCSIEIPGGMVIEMDGARYLRAWALPHFYFHVVTAYDILRRAGVDIGKRDYLSQIGGFIRPKK